VYECSDIVMTLSYTVPMSKNKQTTLQIRLDSETKDQARLILGELGLDLSSAIKLFLRNIIITESIPLELRSEKGMLAERKCDLLRDAARAAAKEKCKGRV
jgi:addiction module RelB/DinJ family antitoxin